MTSFTRNDDGCVNNYVFCSGYPKRYTIGKEARTFLTLARLLINSDREQGSDRFREIVRSYVYEKLFKDRKATRRESMPWNGACQQRAW
jgi:hypothetical protein